MAELDLNGGTRLNIELRGCYFAEFGPWLGAVLSEASREGPEVSDDPRRDEDVPRQVIVCVL